MAFLFQRKTSPYYSIGWNDSNKKRHVITTGCKKKADANIKLTEFNNSGGEKIKKNKDLFGLCKEYESIMQNNQQPKTRQIYKRVFLKMFDIIKNKRMIDFNIIDIEKYKEERLKTINDTSINMELRTIKAIFNYCYDNEYIASRWYKKIKQIPIYEQRKLNIRKDELSAILENTKDPVIRDMIEFGYHTGCRINEIVNLTWKSVDFKKHLLNIENLESFKVKHKKNREIPMNEILYRILCSYRDNSTINIFTRLGRNLNVEYVSKSFKKIVRKLKMSEAITFHSLRHSFITNLADKNIDVHTIMDLAGHSCIETTLKYMHVNMDLKRKAMED